jgi:hypothetical protein
MSPEFSHLSSPVGLRGSPRAVFRHAEAVLEEWRARPANMAAAVAAALDQALAEVPGQAVPAPVAACGAAIAAAVTAHATGFGAVAEPPYHDQRHQAEATLAMGWLCAVALRLGALSPQHAAAGVLAMAGHDLRHDGLVHPAGELEALSAGWTDEFAASCGLDGTARAAIERVILATDPLRPAAVVARDDVLCRLGQEADLFGSTAPRLGCRLGGALGRELAAAGIVPLPGVESFAGRLGWLRTRHPVTAPGQALGIADAIADQVDALAALGGGDAAAGAARLDALPPEAALVAFLAALDALGRG